MNYIHIPYLKNKFEIAKGNINKTWIIINNIINPMNAKQIVSEIKHEGKIINDTK